MKAESTRRDESTGGWPRWAKGAVSAALGFHLVAILAAALATPPMSPLQRLLADQFSGYYALIDQGYSYRYYSPEPPPTPVVEARLRFDDGRPEQTIRLPDRVARPRMLYQRQLALANHLFSEHAARRAIPLARRPESHWGPSYARHLGRVHGCSEVALYVSMHLIPPVDRVERDLNAGTRVDLDAEEFYSVPEFIGDFSCDAS